MGAYKAARRYTKPLREDDAFEVSDVVHED
jgi:hypothetical protein